LPEEPIEAHPPHICIGECEGGRVIARLQHREGLRVVERIDGCQGGI
jgi:hypothetical protein